MSGIDEKIDRLKWHLERNDNHRTAVTSRAAIVLSSTAFLFAGSLILLRIVLTIENSSGHGVNYAALILVILTITLLVVAIYYSINGIVNPRTTTKELFGKDTDDEPLYFHENETLKKYHESYKQFKRDFTDIDKEEYLNNGISALWYGMHHYSRRYENLRTSIRFVFVAVIFNFITILALLSRI